MRMRLLSALLLTTGIACLSWPAAAFEKNFHRVIAIRALELHARCFEHRLDHPQAQAFAEGAIAEDSPTLTRAFNWHFYRQRPMSWMGPIEPTLDRVLDRLWDELKTAVTNGGLREVWETAGRIAHYIQDMSVPSHAIPIYHIGQESFDKFGFAAYGYDGPSIRFIGDPCHLVKELAASELPPIERVAHSAKKTLTAINMRISESADCRRSDDKKWTDLMWCVDPSCAREWPHGGFRKYRGELKGESFGADTAICMEAYKAFFQARYAESVIATAGWIESVRTKVSR